MNHSRRSAMLAPGSTPTPPVTTRVGIPSVCESTALISRVVRTSHRRWPSTRRGQVGVVAERRGEQVLREALVGHGPQEAGDGVGADRGRGRGRRRRVRAAVLLGVGDRDAGRPAVPQHPAGLEGERVPQRSDHRVVVRTDDRRGELAVDRLGHRQQLVLVVVRRDERRGSEAFAEHLVAALPQVGQQVRRRGGQQRRAGRVGAQVGISVAGSEHRHRGLGRQPPQGLDVPLLDPRDRARGPVPAAPPPRVARRPRCRGAPAAPPAWCRTARRPA